MFPLSGMRVCVLYCTSNIATAFVLTENHSEKKDLYITSFRGKLNGFNSSVRACASMLHGLWKIWQSVGLFNIFDLLTNKVNGVRRVFDCLETNNNMSSPAKPCNAGNNKVLTIFVLLLFYSGMSHILPLVYWLISSLFYWQVNSSHMGGILG